MKKKIATNKIANASSINFNKVDEIEEMLTAGYVEHLKLIDSRILSTLEHYLPSEDFLSVKELFAERKKEVISLFLQERGIVLKILPILPDHDQMPIQPLYTMSYFKYINNVNEYRLVINSGESNEHEIRLNNITNEEFWTQFK